MSSISKNAIECFSLDAKTLFSSYFPPAWSMYGDIKANAEAGFMSKKVYSLFESLLEYRYVEDLRCIIFVERVVTAIALEAFLNELIPKYCKWKSKYIAGNQNVLQSQSRNQQNKIVEEFREGKILEAITTKKCQEAYHLESLETLGDSFLKYAVSQQLFKTNQGEHEGLLSLKREKIISNISLCKLGCKRKIPGFIRNYMFEPKNWSIPGDQNGSNLLEEEWVTHARKMYRRGTHKLKAKKVADVVEALIGAFLSCGGEVVALSFMNWLGIEVDFSYVPYNRELSKVFVVVTES